MVRPAASGLASSPADWSHVLYGCDATEGIVSVDADTSGRARVWRRVSGLLEVSELRFPNWFLTTSLDLLSHLPAEHLDAHALREAHGKLSPTGLLTVVELDWPGPADADVYRFLVLTRDLEEIETGMVETSNKRDSGEAQTLADLRGLVLALSPIEQFLVLTGRTYFNNMDYADLRRLQFDLETTGLNEERDRIFMISMRDSSGWAACLDSSDSNEGQLLQRFVELVQMRDPDVLENHNIFAFDLSFLVRRAQRVGVRLALGRDGSEPWLETDSFEVGERGEPFLRWRVAGREVIDTQHAVRRYGYAAPDLRRHGLKDAARYFGFARTDREYVPGVEIWPTFRVDPDRVRRYAAADVEEVDGLSRRLLPMSFGLAKMLPRAYERIAADSSPAALWEPLLVRAYLHQGRAVAAPMPRVQLPQLSELTELFITGVIGPSARAIIQPLLPSVMATNSVSSANDDMLVMPQLLKMFLSSTTSDASQNALARAAHAYLGGQGLFCDPQAATDAAGLARRYVDRVANELRDRHCAVVEMDGEHLLFGTPDTWTEQAEHEVAQRAAAYLPSGVRLTFKDHFQALYARAPRSTITLGTDGGVTLVGNALRPGRLERFAETFILRAAPYALRGDAAGLRGVFLDTVHQLRSAQVPVEDLCVHAALHKSPSQYRRGDTREEPYEVLLSAGVRFWRVGQRIRYFRAQGGEPRLLHEGDGTTAADADAEHYVQRLFTTGCQQFTQAFRRADFARIFRLPIGPGPYAEPEMSAELAGIRPISEPITR